MTKINTISCVASEIGFNRVKYGKMSAWMKKLAFHQNTVSKFVPRIDWFGAYG